MLPLYAAALAVLAAGILLASSATPAGHRFPALFSAGRLGVLIGLAGLLGALVIDRLRPAADRAALASWAAWSGRLGAVALALGLSGLLARHGHDFRLFSNVHSGLFGLLPELALLGVTVGLTRSAPSPLLGAASGLTLALLVAPDSVLGSSTTALGDLLRRGPTHAILALIALALALAGLWRMTARLWPRLPDLPPTYARFAPLVLLITAFGPALTSATPALALGTLAAFIALHHALAAELARARESRATPETLLAAASVVVIVLWLLIKAQALIASNTDENIYFYMAKILGDGQWPYADYFFAHPPLHVVLPGALFSLFGFSLTFAKVMPMAFCLIGALALRSLLARHVSALAAFLGLTLYLFASEVLKASSNMTGVNMTCMFLLLGTWQAMRPRPFTSGILLGLAPATGFYAMAPALALLTLGAFRPHRPTADTTTGPRNAFARALAALRARRLAQPLAFILTLGGINLVFWTIGGDTFLEGVYSYHQQKSFQDPRMVELFGGSPGFPLSIFHNLVLMVEGRAFLKEVFYHPHLWLSLMLVPAVLLASAARFRGGLRDLIRPSRLFTSGPDGAAAVLWLVALALFVQYSMFRELYSFYFALIYPFLAAGSAYLIWRGLSLLAAPFLSSPDLPLPGPRAAPALVAALVSLAALFTLQSHPAISLATLPVFDDELEVLGARNHYAWTPSPVLDDLSPLVRNLFWEDFRIKGDIEPGYRHYLWTKKRGFTRLDEVATQVARAAAPNETIAGSSTLAPLVALLADRRLAADEIDTNNKRFKTGLLAEDDYWRRACADNLRVVVSAPRSYFTFDKLQAMPLIARYFDTPTVVNDPTLMYGQSFPIALFTRRGSAPCAWEGPSSGGAVPGGRSPAEGAEPPAPGGE